VILFDDVVEILDLSGLDFRVMLDIVALDRVLSELVPALASVT
jgi:hypothetical protein